MRCKDCRWWGRHYGATTRDAADKLPCDRIDSIGAEDPPASFEIEVRVDDDSGLRAELVTGREFGCVRFEP